MSTPSYLLNKYNRTLSNPVKLVRSRIAIEGELARKEAENSTKKLSSALGIIGTTGETYNEWEIAKKGGYEGGFAEYMAKSRVGSDMQADELEKYYVKGAELQNTERLEAKVSGLHPKSDEQSIRPTHYGKGDYSGLTAGGGASGGMTTRSSSDPLSAGIQPTHQAKGITLGDYLNEPVSRYGSQAPKFDLDEKEVARLKHEGNKDFSKYGPEGMSKSEWVGTYTEPGKLSPMEKHARRNEDYELEKHKYEQQTGLSEWNRGQNPLESLLDVIENFKLNLFGDKKEKKKAKKGSLEWGKKKQKEASKKKTAQRVESYLQKKVRIGPTPTKIPDWEKRFPYYAKRAARLKGRNK